jgi:hypothetical protein
MIEKSTGHSFCIFHIISSSSFLRQPIHVDNGYLPFFCLNFLLSGWQVEQLPVLASTEVHGIGANSMARAKSVIVVFFTQSSSMVHAHSLKIPKIRYTIKHIEFNRLQTPCHVNSSIYFTCSLVQGRAETEDEECPLPASPLQGNNLDQAKSTNRGKDVKLSSNVWLGGGGGILTLRSQLP